MPPTFHNITFTSQVQAMQSHMGSRSSYARAQENSSAEKCSLGPEELAFIAQRDGFYQSSVSETGWPYVQFRGGPKGFLKVLDGQTVAYADFRGNKQYISVGNLIGNDRVSIILMDYANRRRLKVLGHVKLIEAPLDKHLLQMLSPVDSKTPIERACVITVAGFDWNCPQHITPRFTIKEFREAGYLK
jgi:uncharacterized protein